MGGNSYDGPIGPKPKVAPNPQPPLFRGPAPIRDPRTVAKADLTLSDVLLYEAIFASEEPDIISLDGGPE